MSKPKLSPEFERALEVFLAVVNAQLQRYTELRWGYEVSLHPASSSPNLNAFVPVVVDSVGPRYVRLAHEDGAYCFVDKTNGDLLKVATWRSPAKHARGNIFVYDYLDSAGPYGLAYRDGSKNYKFNSSAGDREVARDALLEGKVAEACRILVNAVAPVRR